MTPHCEDWVTDLIAFLHARLDEDEAAARGAKDSPWYAEDSILAVAHTWPQEAAHVARHGPARALREVEVGRKRLTLYLDAKETLAAALKKAPPDDDPAAAHSYVRERINVNQASGRFTALETSVRLDAMTYSDHPDYRQEWKP